MTDWGGRALCPADEYDDPAIREEMAWHAIEEALTDRYGPGHLPRLVATYRLLRDCMPDLLPPLGSCRMLQTWSGTLTLRATTDEHLGPDASGLVDVTCTLTPA